MAMVESDTAIERLLRHRFDIAAAKSLAVLNLDDAEPEMARFLHLVQKHPDQRPFVAQLFIDSFDGSYYLRGAPWEFLQFCMHLLRWPEIREFILARQDADVSQHDARSSTVWNSVLQAFSHDWPGAEIYQMYARPRDAASSSSELSSIGSKRVADEPDGTNQRGQVPIGSS